MFTEPSSRPLRCCVEGPSGYQPKARYALRMLLLPLGFDPKWAGRDAGPVLYYGPRPPDNNAVPVTLGYDAEAPDYFARRDAYPTEKMRWAEWGEKRWPVLFGNGTEPDLVASAFFWLAGWQEHVIRQRDQHGRFPFDASLQKAWGLARRPVVEAYRERLARRIEETGVPTQWRTWDGRRWAFCPTHDIDYLKKWRMGSFGRAMLGSLFARTGAVRQRHRRRLRQALRETATGTDAFRTSLRRLREETTQRGGCNTFFLKAGAHGERDVRYRLDDPLLQREIQAMKQRDIEIGLHPSYHAHAHGAYFREERARFVEAVGEKPVSVRQHYLRYELPRTSRLQEDAGLRIDSTLGFAQQVGFRRCTCQPFQIFDVSTNAPLALWEMPLILMDTTLFTHWGLSDQEAWDITKELLDACRRFRGAAVMLWHNTCWDEPDYPGGGAHFEAVLEHAVQQEALITSLRMGLQAWMAPPGSSA